MSKLVIVDTAIRTDSEGRYCLNDLHKAAGGEDKHKPAYWLRTAEGLLDALKKGADSHPLQTKLGRNGGTYVCKELVYAYAMWISPEFSLKVIRAYDTLQTQGVAVAENAAEDLLKNPMKYIEALMGQAKELVEQNKLLASENTELSTHNTAMKASIGAYDHTLARVVRTMEGVNQSAVKKSLLKAGYLYTKGGTYRVYAKYSHLFKEKIISDHDDKVDVIATADGKALLFKLYVERRLIMKKGF